MEQYLIDTGENDLSKIPWRLHRKIRKYFRDNKIYFYNTCNGEKQKNINKMKKYKSFNINNNQMYRLDGNNLLEVKKLNNILLDEKIGSKSHYDIMMKGAEFELLCLLGKAGIDIDSPDSIITATLSSGAQGSKCV